MKKKWIIPVLIALGLTAALGVYGYLSQMIWIHGKPVSANTQQLDLSGQPLPELEVFSEFTRLETLNLEDTGLTAAQYDALRQALPNCQIRWLVPFQGAFYPQTTKTVTVSTLSEADIQTLAYLTELTAVKAPACKDYDMLMALQAQRPEITVEFSLIIEGNVVPNSTRELTLSKTSQEELAAVLPYLTKLESLHFTGCQDPLAMYALQQQYPGCRMVYDIPLGGERYLSDTASLTLDASLLPQLEPLLPCFSQLETVALTGMADSALAYRLEQQWQMDFSWEFTLLGVATSTEAKEVDLSKIPLENTQALEAALPYFTRLEKVVMCGCGLSNETMAQLNERYPDTLFVWTVMLGPVEVRTDIIYFMPYQHDFVMNDACLENLKYCTELICLDLGHQDVAEGEYLKYLTKLQYLILGDTDIEDVSFVEYMPDLKFLEIFMTHVHDLRPLASCKKLENLNLSYTKPMPADVTPLLELTQLEQLWMRGNWYLDQQELLRQGLPNTQMIFSHGSSTGDGWRQSKNYYAMRDLLGMWYDSY